MSSISGYINPFSNEFYKAAYDYHKLTDGQKALVITLSVISGVATFFLFGIGGYATFKSLVDALGIRKLQRGDNHTADKTALLTKSLHFHHFQIYMHPSEVSICPQYKPLKFNSKLEELKEYCGTKEADITGKLLELGLAKEEIEACRITIRTKGEKIFEFKEKEPRMEKDKLDFKLMMPYNPTISLECGWPGVMDKGLVDFEIAVKQTAPNATLEKKFAQLLEDLSLMFPVWHALMKAVTAFGENEGFTNYLKSTTSWKSKVEVNEYKLIPLQQESLINFKVHLDKDRNVIIKLNSVFFEFKMEKSSGKEAYYRFNLIENLKVIGSPKLPPSFELAWEQIKLKIEEEFDEFLDETLFDASDDSYDSFEDSQSEFNLELDSIIQQDHLLEMNGMLVTLKKNQAL